ncbi:phosphatidylinositol synthase, partial [Thalassiosira pseudonana CCMP1335]
MATSKPNQTTANEVLLYIPNLIGYIRVIFTLLSLILMICIPDLWAFAIILYVSSFVGDLFDGMAARRFGQCSTFGGLLDMVTDRCSTAGLLCALSNEYSGQPSFLFTMLIILDISSHWCQMYSTTSLKQHHKSAEGNKGRFFLVRWYYLSYPFFGYCCVGAEFTYVTIYVLSRVNASSGDNIDGYNAILKTLCEYVLLISVPACAVKQVVNVSQL